ncbi:DUF4059 family protein [Streptococcus sp. SQ9-PEA]|uniref:DUF4059 family protein n=2 Tax=Streptococcus sciuri TaxID=2973939 RepID=A0ABT2F873_9STRE|nr:DUF4059 family protein [Streptococcus sciuri]
MVQFYGSGLLVAFVLILIVSGIWLLWRISKRKDKTTKERQAFLYDLMMITLITVPILAFAFTTLIVMLRA